MRQPVFATDGIIFFLVFCLIFPDFFRLPFVFVFPDLFGLPFTLDLDSLFDLLPFDCHPEIEKEKDRILIDKMCDLLEEKHRIRIYSYRRKWKETFNIFATGHRDIVNIDDENVREQIREVLKSYQKKYLSIIYLFLVNF